ncbi:MAG: hypothetical protein HYU86_08935 [Chloroflexi bacterium]|nr:hypothetical protein [Chloroflexota bacterium]
MSDRDVVQLEAGQAPHIIKAVAVRTADGISVTLTGGDIPHIGAVAVAVPRPSLTGDGSISATVSLITLIGHKDDEVARPAAQRLARALNQPVVVAAGIHVGPPHQYNIPPEDIAKVMENCQEILGRLIKEMQA